MSAVTVTLPRFHIHLYRKKTLMPLPRTLLGARETWIGDTVWWTIHQNKTRRGQEKTLDSLPVVLQWQLPPPQKKKKKNPAELMRNRISSRSLILSFLVHLFYKKVGLDPYPNQFPGRFLRSTHNKSLIDGAQCSKFWFVIHAMTDFKQRKYLIFNAFSSGLHFAMKALKIALWKNQWRPGSSGQ